MKSISLYVDKDTWLTRMHPFTKLCYILTAISVSLIWGKLWAFGIFIGISLVMLISGKIIRRVFPLIAFSFTILITIFLIHGLFNHENATLLFAAGPIRFYREGVQYAARISCNVLNMLLAFAVFVLTTKPVELVEDKMCIRDRDTTQISVHRPISVTSISSSAAMAAIFSASVLDPNVGLSMISAVPSAAATFSLICHPKVPLTQCTICLLYTYRCV